MWNVKLFNMIIFGHSMTYSDIFCDSVLYFLEITYQLNNVLSEKTFN